MKSPELDPELVRSLLSALSDWEQSETIAFSHDFMRLGDEEALASYDAMGLANPVIQDMLKEVCRKKGLTYDDFVADLKKKGQWRVEVY